MASNSTVYSVPFTSTVAVASPCGAFAVWIVNVTFAASSFTSAVVTVTAVAWSTSSIFAVTVSVFGVNFSKFPPSTLVIALSNVLASLYTSSVFGFVTSNVPVLPSVIVISPNVVCITTGSSPARTGFESVAVNTTVPAASFVSVAANVTVVSVLEAGVSSSEIVVATVSFPKVMFSKLPESTGVPIVTLNISSPSAYTSSTVATLNDLLWLFASNTTSTVLVTISPVSADT